MKLKILLTIICFPLLLSAQSPTENPLEEEVANINRKLKMERSRVNELQAKVMLLEGRFRRLSDSLQSQISTNLELQAQNERAVNLALDQFSKKFEEQNATMDGVKATLDKQWSSQLIFYFVALAILILALFAGIRISNKKAIENHQSLWNQFNEYIIKR